MDIAKLLAKVANGETLTDAEKAALKGFSLQGELDKVAAAARRKADEAKAESEKKIAELTAALEEAKKANNNPANDTELAKLQAQVAKLQKANEKYEAEAAKVARTNAINAAAKAAGISAADGVSADVFARLLDIAVGDTKLDDADAMKTALEAFKTGNPALIADSGIPGVAVKGGGAKNPIALPGGKNPFAKDSQNLTAQMQLLKENPTEAARLAAEAGVTLPGATA